MRNLKALLRVVGAIQIVLGIMYLFAPAFLLEAMGHSVPDDDVFYPLAMLAGRFLAYGAAMIYISSEPERHRLWVDVMIGIQLIDLAAGVFYTATGVVSLSLSGFPIFNAIWIAGLLYFWRPNQEPVLHERAATTAASA
ncbi:MAG: hypothetical protein V3V01_09830 [Acidimicrobiales bacterium]